MSEVSVSVVIPTLGRPELRRAVESCITQTLKPVEVLVVPDGPKAEVAARSVLGDISEIVRLLPTQSKLGGAHARNVGTEAAVGSLIAYLDDDDIWLPEKLQRQVRSASELITDGRPFVATCRSLFHRTGKPEWPASIYPTEPLPAPKEVGTYLVERKHPLFGTSMIQSSSLLLDALTARKVGWDQDLLKHQDWDFVIRAARLTGNLLDAGAEPLARVFQGTTGSVSQQSSWRSSISFIRKHPSISLRARADFAITHVLAPALENGGAFEFLKAMRAYPPRTLPHVGAMAVLSRGILRRLRTLISSVDNAIR